MAASDAASLAMAASCGKSHMGFYQSCTAMSSNSFGRRQLRTLVKGFSESRSSAAFQVSRRALSNATAMSASLN